MDSQQRISTSPSSFLLQSCNLFLHTEIARKKCCVAHMVHALSGYIIEEIILEGPNLKLKLIVTLRPLFNMEKESSSVRHVFVAHMVGILLHFLISEDFSTVISKSQSRCYCNFKSTLKRPVYSIY